MPGGMNPPYNRQKGSGKGCRGRRPRRPAEGSPPPLQATLKGVRRAACPQAAAGVVGGCPLMGGHARPVGTLQASQARPALHCVGRLLRGRSPREKPPHQGRWPRSRPEGFSPLTGSIARLRAGHARPLRTAVNWLRTRGAREGGSPPPFPLTGGDARPVGTLQASQARPAPLMGSLFPLAGVRGNTRI